MLGKSGRYPRIGLAFALVAVVGYVALGWRFGGDTDPVPLAIALVAVALAVGSTLRDRL